MLMFEDHSTILFIGDSISDYDRARPVGEGLFNAWGTSYVANVGALLGSTCPEKHLRVVNMGIGGNQARDLENRWQTDVMDRHPDYVSVLIGINDVWRHFDVPELKEQHVSPEDFEACYERLITRTLPVVKGMILMTPYIMEPNKSDPMREKMDIFGGIVKKLAEKYGLVCVDLQASWDELFTHCHPMSIAWDRIHPNQVGCMRIAREFLNAVGYEW